MNTSVRCATRNGRSANSVQFSQFNTVHKVETPSKMSYLLFISSRCQNRRMFLPRIAEYTWKLLSLPASQNRRMFGNKGYFPLCQRFRKFRSEFEWKGSFWFLLNRIFGITSEVVHTSRSTEIRRSIFDKPVVCPNYRSW